MKYRDRGSNRIRTVLTKHRIKFKSISTFSVLNIYDTIVGGSVGVPEVDAAVGVVTGVAIGFVLGTAIAAKGPLTFYWLKRRGR